MKSEIDVLMEKQNIDVMLVTGSGMHNPYMVYMIGGTYHISQADLIKKRNEKPVLFHNDMERDEAARSGLELRNLNNYNYRDLLKQTNNNELQASILLYQKIFNEMGITSGRIAVFGQSELGRGMSIFQGIKDLFPELEFVAVDRKNFLTEARQTKDANEIEHIRQMGKNTTAVVANTADFLSSHSVKNGVLVKKSGAPLTIGDVKKKINLWIAENGGDNPEGTIFSIGRDAGVPHSSGTESDVIETGKTIVFDIYPCEAGGGYFYDFTRTWCIGYAPDRVLEIYQDVSNLYKKVVSELEINKPLYYYQKMTCEFFEGRGHPSVLNTPSTSNGYNHSLSHGLGLNVHENPFSGISMEMSDKLLPNSVFTVEPGLYYPDENFGLRIEDTYWARPDGKFECLADFPYDLIIPTR